MEEDKNPLIYLNVGGYKYVTLKSTLENKAFAPNFLSQLIQNDVDKKLPVRKDNKNRYFIDRNGLVFGIILDYLRTSELNIPDTVTKRQVEVELDYYGLVDISPTKSLNSIVDSWKIRAKGILI
jgi:hypothetical protein